MFDNILDVVVRCKNEMPYAQRTFEALRRTGHRVWVIDSGSTDGSREHAVDAGFFVVDIDPDSYIPGHILNLAMETTLSPVVAFVNADAIPLSDDAVDKLVEACEQGAAAAYGKQVPRPDARDDTKRDYARAFPDTPSGPGFLHFFSMAASAIRRDVWEELPFDPTLRYSEDIDWTWRLRALGLPIVYVPDARFEHSHDYDHRALLRRMRGEGQADRVIFRSGPPSLLRDLVRPLAGATLRDLRDHRATIENLRLRAIAQYGRFDGRTKLDTALRTHTTSDRIQRWSPEMKLTSLGSEEAEAVVRRALQTAIRITDQHLAGKYQALLLIGGYASGHGAMDIVDGAPAIHNDVDLVLVVPTTRDARALRKTCEQISREATQQVGAPIDLYPVSEDELRDPKGKLLWVDAAVRGALVLSGSESVVEPLRTLTSRSVDSDELGRLLVNRATGIALSRLAFEQGLDENERAARHIAKMWLALGDALLIQVTEYDGGYDERLATLTRLARIGDSFVADIRAGYQEAVSYRRDPASHSATIEQLDSGLPTMWSCFSRLEGNRLGVRPWLQPLGYAEDRAPKFPHKTDIPPLSRYLGGARAALQGKIAWHKATAHPRELLGRVAPVLAFCENIEKARRTVAPWMRCDSSAPDTVAEGLERLREVGS